MIHSLLTGLLGCAFWALIVLGGILGFFIAYASGHLKIILFLAVLMALANAVNDHRR